MMSKTMIKIICFVMAALMVLSVGAVALQIFAVDGTVAQTVTPAAMSVTAAVPLI